VAMCDFLLAAWSFVEGFYEVAQIALYYLN